MDEMNDSSLWAKASRYYEQLSAIVDLRDFGSLDQGSRYFE